VNDHVKIRLSGVSQTFDTTPVLSRTDLEVRDSEFLAVVGPSGCGKSTMFNVVAGLLEPTTGTVELDGADVTGRPGHVGYMLQKDLLLPWRTVLDNVLLGPKLRGRVTAEQRRGAVDLLDQYGLGAFRDHYPHALSGGMRQRVALIRTMLFSQGVMLLDEPFGALDSQTRILMQEWLLSVWDDIRSTILFITHDVDEALVLADRVLVMSSRPGRIKDEVVVPFPRPRDHSVIASPEFAGLKQSIFQSIYEESVKAAQQLEVAEGTVS
jgi:ABC-type nitrate/sulfonate/bicarbonate transport system ATPase subunit